MSVTHKLNGLKVALAKEQTLIGEQLVEHNTERENIEAVVYVEPLDLLGGHIAELTLEHPCACGLIAPIFGLSDAKVDQLHLALIRDQDVLRGDIAMDNLKVMPLLVTQGVCVVEGVGD